MGRTDAPPESFFACILEIFEARAQLRGRHIQQRQDVIVLAALNRIRVAYQRLVQPRAVKHIGSVGDRQNFMLWLIPFQAHECRAAGDRDVGDGAVILV